MRDANCADGQEDLDRVDHGAVVHPRCHEGRVPHADHGGRRHVRGPRGLLIVEGRRHDLKSPWQDDGDGRARIGVAPRATAACRAQGPMRMRGETMTDRGNRVSGGPERSPRRRPASADKDHRALSKTTVQLSARRGCETAACRADQRSFCGALSVPDAMIREILGGPQGPGLTPAATVIDHPEYGGSHRACPRLDRTLTSGAAQISAANALTSRATASRSAPLRTATGCRRPPRTCSGCRRKRPARSEESNRLTL